MLVLWILILGAFLATPVTARPSKMVEQVDTSRSSIQKSLDQGKIKDTKNTFTRHGVFSIDGVLPET